MIHLQFDFVLNLSVLVHLNNARCSRLRNHRQSIVEALEGVNFNALALVAIHFASVVFPNGLLVRRDLHDFRPALLKENVSIWQDRRVVNRADFHFPFHRAIRRDDGEPSRRIVRAQHAPRRAGLFCAELKQ